MSWKETWRTIFWPEWASGGLDLVRDQVALRVFENAEAPATTGTLSAAWTGTNVTVTRETTAPLNGEGSMKVVVAGGTGSVYKSFDRAMFGFPFPGYEGIRIRYVKFRATCSTGSKSFRLTFGDASDANHYRYWSFTVEQDKYVEWVVDLDPDNTESYPAPTTGSSTWTPKDIDRFGFTNLENGATYYFDDIEFLYEYSLMDILGFPTEAPVDMGDYGTINARINGLWANVKALEGRTYQYDKVYPSELEVGDEAVWGLELMSDFAPPTTTEITPGNYNIVRVRHGASTTIVASTPASESAGLIYATYQPQEDNWTEGDIMKVQFTDGYIRTDEDPSHALTGNATAGDNHVHVANAYEYQVGWLVRLYDSATPAGEWLTVDSLPDPTTVQFTTNVVGNYTTGNTATVTRSIRTDLDTALMITRLVREPMIEFEGNSFFESDREDGAHTQVGDNVHWDFQNYKAGGGTQTGGISAGKVNVQVVDAGDYAARDLYDFLSKYFRVVVDVDATFTSVGAAGGGVGIGLYKGTAYDANNHFEIKLFEDNAATDVIRAVFTIDGASTTVDVSTSDDAVALMIERNDRTFRAWYSLTKFPDYEWTLISEFDDDGDHFGEQSSALLFVEAGNAGATVAGAFDNFKYIINSKFLEQMYDIPAVIPVFDKQADPRVDQNTPNGIEIFRVGLMDIKDGLPTAAEITPGTTLVDRFREGTDADWTNQAGETITNGESAGYIYALYDFPTATWKPGDQARMRLTGVKVTDATTGRVYEVPDFSIYFVVGGPPNQNETQNYWLGDVIGNKTDDPDYTFDATTSALVAFVKGILGVEVIEEGTLTTSSATVPADTGLGAYASDYFKGSWLMTVEGAVKFQPRLIIGFTTATGVFTLDQEQPFTAAPGTSKYVILSRNSQLTPATDGLNNSTPAHTIGSKADTADFTWDVTTSSLVRLIKGILGVEVIEEGTFTTSSATVPADTTIGGVYPNDYFNGSWLMPVTGANAFQPRLICDFATATGVFTLDTEQPFNNAPGLVAYVILSRNSQLAPAANSTATQTPAHVIGNKADDADWTYNATASSLMRLLKGVLGALVIGEGTLTTSSATVPADTGQAAKVTGFYKGSWLMPLTGDCAFQPRLITEFTTGTGVFTIDLDQPFTAATGLVTYVILSPNSQVVPAADSGSNQTPAHVVGNKTETTVPKPGATNSLAGYLKAAVARGMAILQATVTTGASTTVVSATGLIGFTNSFFNDNFYMQVIKAGGAAPEHEVRKITAYTSATGTFTCDAFSDLIDAGDEILIIHESLIAVGRNDADNIFDSSAVVANVDGSVLERQEWMQTHGVSALFGIVTTGGSDVGLSALRLTGYGDDFFKTHFYVQVLKSATVAIGTTKQITGYTSTTGAFTFASFGANFGVGDLFVVIHESIVAVGRDDANNEYASTNVVGNQDGSLLERLEFAQSHGALGFVGTVTTGGASTSLSALNLAGYGTDYFVGQYYIQVLKSALVTTGVTKKITAYTSATGAFTFATFGANWTAGDTFVILHESQVAIGRDDVDNEYASTNVVGNQDGSVFERLELAQSHGILGVFGVVSTGGSDVTLAAVDLIGYGDDFFKTQYYVQVIKSALVTLGTTKVVTGYTSATGTFTFGSFGANFTAGDIIVVIHESVVAIGRNDANNEYDSSAVTPNADGSVLERLEDIHDDVGDASGLFYRGVATGGSATTAVVPGLIGFGDDYFNTKFFIQIVYNANSHGNSPEPKTRVVTDYDTASGTFSFATVTDAVEAGDYILVFHESLAATGRNDADNAFDSSSVVGNQDGSILERIEFAQSHGLAAVFGVVTTGGSDVTLAALDLVGYGDDFFKTHFYVQVLKSTLVTIGTTKKVTGYTSATGVFTFASFGANFTAGDIIVVLHESLMAIGRNDADNTFDSSLVVSNDDGSILERLEWIQNMMVIAKGTFTTSSATVPADTGRTEGNDYFNGSWVMPLTGNDMMQPRLIVDFTTGTGVMTLDPEQPFTAAPGLVEYVILAPKESLVPAADGVNNFTPAHVLGNKADATKPVVSATSSAMGYLKALIARGMVSVFGNVTTGGSDVTLASTDLVGYGDDFFKDLYYVQVLKSTLVTEGTTKKVTGYTSNTGTFTFGSFGANFTAGDVIVLLHESLVAIGRDDANNEFASTNVAANVDGSIIERLESLQAAIQAVAGGSAGFEVDGSGATVYNTLIAVYGEADAGSDADTLVDAARAEGNDYWDGAVLLMLTGNNAGLARPIVDWTLGTTSAEIRPAYPNAIGAGDKYIILAIHEPQVPAADSTENYMPRDVVGNKTDKVVPKPLTTASMAGMLKAMLARGMVSIQGQVTTAAGAPTLGFLTTDLIGFTNDFFNNCFYAMVIKTTDGAAPVGEVKKITDYVTATGEFVTDAFSANVDVGDEVLIIHESLVAIGRNDADNVFSSSSVAANEDGSILERLEDLKNGSMGMADIFGEIESLLMSRSYNGTLTAADAAGTENELFSHIPVGVAKPLILMVNLDNMAAGDAIDIKLYYQFTSGGGWVQTDYQSYGGADGGLTNGNKVVPISLDPNPYGVRVTLNQTDGTARDFAWFSVVDQ